VLGARRLLAAAVVAGAILVGVGIATLVVPATSVASCAGCAQYTNPLGSSTQSATQTASHTASAPATQTPTQTATSPPSTTPASTGAAVAPDETATTTDPEPTATAASGAAAGSSTTSDPALPRTGFDSWTIVGFGVVLIGGGFVVRRRIRRT
jgi:LPXTG-motif cell wall-anchored protein